MRRRRRMLALAGLVALALWLANCGGTQTASPNAPATEKANTDAANSPTGEQQAAGGNSNAAPAQSPPRILYILDASGSMQGKVGNEEKMAAARRVLKDSVGKLADAAQVGLIAYGHRSANDCNDIEILTPLGPLDRAALARQIDALKPKGKTPITNSLQKAFEVVRAQAAGGPITVVLISDGLETCDGDPCRLTRETKAAGVNFVLHVIGFDVGKVSVAQLECVAQAGSGLYLGAQNADELAAALEGAVQPVAVSGGRLSIKAIADGKLTDAVVIVRRAGTSEDVTGGRTYDASDTNPRVLPLPAGSYDVTVNAVKLSGGPTLKFADVKINAGETVERVADFSAGELAITVLRNGKPSDAVVQVYAAGAKEATAMGRTGVQSASNPFVFRLAPGNYEVSVKSNEIPGGPIVRLTDVVIGGDKRVQRTADFTTGTLRVGATQGGQLIDAVVAVTNLATNEEVGALRTYTNAKTNPRVFELLPGRYRVRLSAVKPPGLQPQELTVEIKPGETLERTANF